MSYAADGSCTPGFDCGYWSSSNYDLQSSINLYIFGLTNPGSVILEKNHQVRQRPALYILDNYSKYYSCI